jgi:heme exporter protein A
MLSIRNLTCERGRRELFSKLSFELHPGELLYIRGANGSGKTTLLRSICGLSRPTAGDILWHDKPVAEQVNEYHQQLCYLGHRNGLHPELTAYENLQNDISLHAETSTENTQTALQAAGIADKTDVAVKYLSQGQQRRVALCKCLLRNSKLWVLDEPFTALDDKAIDWFINVIGQHLVNGGMVLLTTHQETAVSTHVTREILLVTEGIV